MPWFSKTFIAIALHQRRNRNNYVRTQCESYAERLMYRALKEMGFKTQWKFGRGHGTLGRFRVDFYHPKTRLAVEIDGASHEGPEAEVYDLRRTQLLIHQYGVRSVMRFRNEQIYSRKERKKAIAAVKTRLSLLASSFGSATESI